MAAIGVTPGRVWLARLFFIAPFLLFLAVYVPTTGHGFVRDDYSWISASRVRTLPEFLHLFKTDNGFYRPIVAATFAINEWIFGIAPLGYGLTNVLLALLCSASVGRLARALGLAPGAATFAAALWLLNFHGIGMAVLWVSGRTSLLATLGATLSATALVRGRTLVAGAWLLMALLAKEETVLLPLILLSWLFILRRFERRVAVSPALWAGLAGVVELVYFILRSGTNAMTPATAPSFYRFTFEASALARNLLEYADRDATLSAIAVLAAAIVLGRAKPFLDSAVRGVVLCGVEWLVLGAAPTVLLPVRSDLYACLPSVGVCLAAAAVGGRLWQQASEMRRRRLVAITLVTLIALGPWYYARTRRWVSMAEFSATTLADLARLTMSLPEGAHVVVRDDRNQRANLAASFGTLLDEAFTLKTGRRLSFWIEPALDDLVSAGRQPPCEACVSLRLRVSGGRVVE